MMKRLFNIIQDILPHTNIAISQNSYHIIICDMEKPYVVGYLSTVNYDDNDTSQQYYHIIDKGSLEALAAPDGYFIPKKI